MLNLCVFFFFLFFLIPVSFIATNGEILDIVRNGLPILILTVTIVNIVATTKINGFGAITISVFKYSLAIVFTVNGKIDLPIKYPVTKPTGIPSTSNHNVWILTSNAI